MLRHFGRIIGLGALVLLSACSQTLLSEGGKQPVTTPVLTAEFDTFRYQGESLNPLVLASDEFQNPILAGYYPDPSVLRVGDDFYLVNSSFAHFPGLPVFHSRDLVNWTQITNAINRTSQFDFSGAHVSRGIFAPDISYHNGLFYIVSTCVTCGGNFVMTAKDPAGPWSDPTFFDFEGIDPSIFWDGDKAFILNNGAPNEVPRYEGHRAIWQQEFDWRNKKMVGERRQLVNGGVDITKKPIWIEGPHLFKHGDYYYITAAEGGTAEDHSQTIFRSKSVTGPFIPAAHNPILTQRDLDPNRRNPITSAGHAKFVQLKNGDWWATFLAVRPYDLNNNFNIGRETFLLPVTWHDGWPYMLPPGEEIPFQHKKPALPQQQSVQQPTTGNFSYMDGFDGEELSLPWVGIRIPEQPLYQIQNSKLKLYCRSGFGDLNQAPSFVGRRQQHAKINVSAKMSFAPNIDGDRAGLVAVQNDESLIFFGVEQTDGVSRIVVYNKDRAQKPNYLASMPISKASDLILSIEIDAGKANFRYTQSGEVTTIAEGVDATVLSTKRATGFVGTIIGPYCESPDAA